METRNYIIIPILLLLASCASYNFNKEDIEGTYIQQEYKGIELEFDKSTFVLKDVYTQEHLPPYDCCDTITLGNWTIDDRGLLSLSSPEGMSSFFVNMDVVEEKKTTKDSIYLTVNNPIESFYKKTNSTVKDISYQLVFTTNKSTFDNKVALKTFNTNRVVIPRPEGLKISQLELVVYIDCKISLKNLETREVYTLPYEVQNVEANIFKIDIPKLDYKYLSYRRLNKDYIKIINKNKLLWDGKEYLKK